MKKTLTTIIMATTLVGCQARTELVAKPTVATMEAEAYNAIPIGCYWNNKKWDPCYLRDFDGDGHVDTVDGGWQYAFFATPNVQQKGQTYPLLYNVGEKTLSITPELQKIFDDAYSAGQKAMLAMAQTKYEASLDQPQH